MAYVNLASDGTISLTFWIGPEDLDKARERGACGAGPGGGATAPPLDLFFQISIAGLYQAAISETIALPGLFFPEREPPGVRPPLPTAPAAGD